MSDAPRTTTPAGDGRVIGATGGAVGLGALAAALGTCCVAPWAVSVVGVTGAVALARLAFLEPVLLAGALLLLGVAFYFAYRPLPVCEDGSCDRSSQRRLRWIAWIGAGVVAAILVATFMQYL
jgi:hypothetical protein